MGGVGGSPPIKVVSCEEFPREMIRSMCWQLWWLEIVSGKCGVSMDNRMSKMVMTVGGRDVQGNCCIFKGDCQ